MIIILGGYPVAVIYEVEVIPKVGDIITIDPRKVIRKSSQESEVLLNHKYEITERYEDKCIDGEMIPHFAIRSADLGL